VGPVDLGWPRYPRNAAGVWHAIEDLRTAVDSLRQADKIADEVAEALINNKRRLFTTGERVLAASVGVVVAVSSVVGMIFAIRGGGH
jgi:hypothetical protein